MRDAVLVHGFGSAPAEWDAVAAALAEAGVAARSVELPGLGARRDEDFAWRAAIDAVLDAIDAGGPRVASGGRDAAGSTGSGDPVEADGAALAPVVAGRAIGGHLAIAAAAERAAAGSPVGGVVAAGIGTETLGWLADSYRVASVVSGLLPDRGDSVGALAGATFAGRAGDGGAGRLTPAALDEVQRFDVRAAIARLDAPFVLANGSRDRMRMQERALLRAARGGRLERIRGAAYADRLDEPAALAAVIASLAGAGAGASG
jgi:hypothetical protein